MPWSVRNFKAIWNIQNYHHVLIAHYLQHQLARPIIRHHRQVVEVLNNDLVGQNVAAIFSALSN